MLYNIIARYASFLKYPKIKGKKCKKPEERRKVATEAVTITVQGLTPGPSPEARWESFCLKFLYYFKFFTVIFIVRKLRTR